MVANCIADPSKECLSLARVEALEKLMDEHKKNASEKHKEFFARIRALEQARAVQEEQYKTILAKLETVADAVSVLMTLVILSKVQMGFGGHSPDQRRCRRSNWLRNQPNFLGGSYGIFRCDFIYRSRISSSDPASY